MKKVEIKLVIGWALLMWAVPVLASEDTGHGHHDIHKHHVTAFLGNTTNYKGQNAFTVGLDYEYRLDQLWGLAALFDNAGDGIQTTVIAVGAILHPVGGLKLQAAPGLDFHGSKEEFVIRFGVLYDFQVGNWTLGPAAYLDVLEAKESLIFGMSFGRGF